MNYFYSFSPKEMKKLSIKIQLWNLYINSERLEKQNQKTANFCKKMGEDKSARHFTEIAKIYKNEKKIFHYFYKISE